MRIAFKEWAVVVDALLRGDQILILRKGGIAEGRGGFKAEHERFLLFPTQFHQQRESVVPTAQARYDAIAPNFPPQDRLRVEGFAAVAAARQLQSPAAAAALRGHHIWRDEIIAQRFDWGREKSIFALLVRVFRLPRPVELPMLEAYGGCKSWIELAEDIAVESAAPVLDDAVFEQKLAAMNGALQPFTQARPDSES